MYQNVPGPAYINFTGTLRFIQRSLPSVAVSPLAGRGGVAGDTAFSRGQSVIGAGGGGGGHCLQSRSVR